MKTERLYGLDILRVFSMVGIIGLHILNNGGMLAAANTTPKLIIARLAAVVFYSSVDIFAMLTGYLYAQRKTVRSSNLINLIFTVAFYCVTILVGFVILKPELFVGFRGLYLYSLFPPYAGRFWYITSYVLLFVMIPYLNAMIHALQEYQYRKMLLILFVLLSVISTFGLNDYFKISNGYSPFWLIYCYLIGGYIKLHKDQLPKDRIKKWLIMLTATILTMVALWFILGDNMVNRYFLVFNYISPFIVIEAALWLLVFSKITIQNSAIQKVVQSLSNGAFGVYIIHSHILVFDYLLADAFAWTSRLGFFIYAFMLFAGLIGIYLICGIIDMIRNHLFTMIRIHKLSNCLGTNIDTLLSWK